MSYPRDDRDVRVARGGFSRVAASFALTAGTSPGPRSEILGGKFPRSLKLLYFLSGADGSHMRSGIPRAVLNERRKYQCPAHSFA